MKFLKYNQKWLFLFNESIKVINFGLVFLNQPKKLPTFEKFKNQT